MQLKTQEKNLDPFKIKRRDYTHAYMCTHAPLYVYLCEDFHRHNELRSPLYHKRPSYPPEPNPDLNPILTLTFKAISKSQTVFWSFDQPECLSSILHSGGGKDNTHTYTHSSVCANCTFLLQWSKSIARLTLREFSDSTYSRWKGRCRWAEFSQSPSRSFQEKSRRTGPAEGEGERHTKAAEERAAERLTIEESNNECLFGCRRKSVESSALTETQTLAYILWGFSRRKEGGNKRPTSQPRSTQEVSM